jgi:hypothetical protein
MLSIDRCRQLLGPAAIGMSDIQIERLRGQLYGLADVTVSVFLERRKLPPDAIAEERS